MSQDPIDPSSLHEVLDRTHLMSDLFDRHVLEHPELEKDVHAELRRAAAAISDQIGRLYQDIGSAFP